MIRRRLLAIAGATILAAGFGVASTAPSGASPAQGARLGLKLIHPAPAKQTATLLSLHSSSATGVISPKPKVYLVFWGSQWSSDPAGAAPALQAMFSSLYGSQDTWGTILDQYCEGLAVGTTHCGSSGTHVKHPTSSILGGVWFDNAAAEPSRATAAQLAAEAVKAAGHFGNTTQSPNLEAQYVIASPTGTHPNGFPNTGFCGWHSFTSSTYGKVAFTNLPYVPDLGAGPCTTLSPARLIDGYESTETHEYAETVTDLYPSRGWLTSSGNEIGDLCINLDAYLTTSGGQFDVQGLWSNSAVRCVTHG